VRLTKMSSRSRSI